MSQLVNFKNAIWTWGHINRFSRISTRTMHQSSTLSLSHTFWPRWASRLFNIPPIVQTFLPVTFGYSLSSDAIVMRQLRIWRVCDEGHWHTHTHTHTQVDFHGAFQLEEITLKGTWVSCAHTKKVGNLFNDPRIYIYIYIYIYICIYI